MDTKALKKRLKELLQADHIKLWDPPYTDAVTEQGCIPESLVNDMADRVPSTDKVAVAAALENLRLASLDRKAKKAAAAPATLAEAPSDADPAGPAAPAAPAPDSLDAPAVVATATPIPIVVTRTPSSAPAQHTPPPRASPETLRAAPPAAAAASAAATSEDKKKKGGLLANPFKQKKKEAVSFENEGFFLRKEDEESSKDPNEEPVYFDDLSPEEQARYQKELEAKRQAKKSKKKAADEPFNPFAVMQADVDSAAVAGTEPTQSADAADAAHEEVGLRNTSAGRGAAIGWRLSESGTRMVMDLGGDSPTPAAAAGSTIDGADGTDGAPPPPAPGIGEGPAASSADAPTEEPVSATPVAAVTPAAVSSAPPTASPNADRKKFPFSFKKKATTSTIPTTSPAASPSPAPAPSTASPTAPVSASPVSAAAPAVKSDFRAKDLLMTDAQRIQVMMMVKDGHLTVDQAIARVMATEQDLQRVRSATVVVPSGNAADSTAAAAAPSTEPVAAPRRKRNPFAVPNKGEAPEEGSIRANEMLISEDDRISIMKEVKAGHISVEEAVQRVVDLEFELRKKKAEADNAAKVKAGAAPEPAPVPVAVADISAVFSDEDLTFMEVARGAAPSLRHASLSRPKGSSKRPPSRDKVRESRLLKDGGHTDDAVESDHNDENGHVADAASESQSNPEATVVQAFSVDDDDHSGNGEDDDSNAIDAGATATASVSVSVEGTVEADAVPSHASAKVARPSVGDWLAKLGLGHHHERFVANGFEDLEFVEEMEASDLQDMGVTDAAEVELLLAAALAVRNGDDFPAVSTKSAGAEVVVAAAAADVVVTAQVVAEVVVAADELADDTTVTAAPQPADESNSTAQTDIVADLAGSESHVPQVAAQVEEADADSTTAPAQEALQPEAVDAPPAADQAADDAADDTAGDAATDDAADDATDDATEDAAVTLAEQPQPQPQPQPTPAAADAPVWNPFSGEPEPASAPAPPQDQTQTAPPPSGMTDAERAAKYAALEGRPVVAADTTKHSKIYAALNAQSLYADDGAPKETTKVVVGVRNVALAALVNDGGAGDDAEVDDADEDYEVRLERMRQRALEASKEFEVFADRRKSLTSDPFSPTKRSSRESNPFAASNPFEDPAPEDDAEEFNEEEFMDELSRKRAERDQAQAAHAAELQRIHAARKAQEDALRIAEQRKFEEQLKAERAAAEEAKAKVAIEAQGRLETLSFDFTFGAPAPAAEPVAPAAAPVAKKAPPPVAKKTPKT